MSEKKLGSVTVYFDYDDMVALKRVSEQLGLSTSSIVRLSVKYVLREVLPYITGEQFVRTAVKETRTQKEGI